MAIFETFENLRPLSGRLRRAIDFFEDDEHVYEGFKRLARLASQNVLEAQYRVGRAYLEARGTPYQFRDGGRWLRRAAEAGHIEARYFLAMLYVAGLPKGYNADGAGVFNAEAGHEREPDLEAALPWALAAAEAGHAEAAGLLGYIYGSGPATVRDEAKSLDWYGVADKRGAPQGSLGLGLAKLRDEPSREAVALLEKAARAALPSALFYLGWIYEVGIAVEIDLQRAASSYEKAAELGVASAALRFAICLIHGRGVDKDLFRAETWLRRAALKGEAEASAILGDLNIRGFDHAPNYEDAAKWYRLAAELQHAPAARGLALLHLMGAGVPRDLELSAQWFDTAAEMGDAVANSDSGNLALSGVGSDLQRVNVYARFEKAAEEGDEMAAFNLGVCLARGVGVAPDPQAALHWMTLAAEKVVNAQYWLGRLYSGEFGVPADIDRSVIWLEKAVSSEMPEAQVALAQFLVTGKGHLSEDHPRALQLYRAAAGKGLTDGMFGLGAMLGGGHKIKTVNRAEAQHWFRLAAERGHGLAQLMVGRYLERGLGGEVNLEEAELWYARAEKTGVAEAARALEALKQSLADDAE